VSLSHATGGATGQSIEGGSGYVDVWAVKVCFTVLGLGSDEALRLGFGFFEALWEEQATIIMVLITISLCLVFRLLPTITVVRCDNGANKNAQL
jgi:hypothetical protein